MKKTISIFLSLFLTSLISQTIDSTLYTQPWSAEAQNPNMAKVINLAYTFNNMIQLFPQQTGCSISTLYTQNAGSFPNVLCTENNPKDCIIIAKCPYNGAKTCDKEWVDDTNSYKYFNCNPSTKYKTTNAAKSIKKCNT